MHSKLVTSKQPFIIDAVHREAEGTCTICPLYVSLFCKVLMGDTVLRLPCLFVWSRKSFSFCRDPKKNCVFFT